MKGSNQATVRMEPKDSQRVDENAVNTLARSPRSSIDTERKASALQKVNQTFSNSNPAMNDPGSRASDSGRVSKAFYSNMNSPISNILAEAEDLLSEVQNISIKKSNDVKSNMNSLSHLISSASPIRSRYHDSIIENLLNGLPDLYDEDDPPIDDELIDKLLKQGGNPPSQLIFPSIYAANQRLMQRLQTCNRLEVSALNLMINSVKYGLRKDSTYIHIRPPLSGVVYAASSSNPAAMSSRVVAIPLHDLKEKYIPRTTPISQINQKILKTDKKLSLQEFFSGSIDLNDIRHDFPIQMTDKCLQDWLANRSSDDSCIRIELHSLLYPIASLNQTSSKTKPKLSPQPVCFGYVDVPLSGLINTESLDAIVTCQLTADAATLASVTDRLSSLPTGSQRLYRSNLSSKMGSITLRLCLRPDEGLSDEKMSDRNTSSGRDNDIETKAVMMIPMNESNDKDIDEIEDIDRDVDNALQFIPSEPKSATIVPLKDKNHTKSSQSIADKDVDRYLGISVVEVSVMSSTIQKTISKISSSSSYHADKPSMLVIRSKDMSKRVSESVIGEISSNITNKDVLFRMEICQIYRLNQFCVTNQWQKPFIFEIWAVTRHRDKECLLGLAKIHPSHKLDTLMKVDIADIQSFDICGHIHGSVHLADELEEVSRQMQSMKQSFQVLSSMNDSEDIDEDNDLMDEEKSNEKDETLPSISNDHAKEEGGFKAENLIPAIPQAISIESISHDVVTLSPSHDLDDDIAEDEPEPRALVIPEPIPCSPPLSLSKQSIISNEKTQDIDENKDKREDSLGLSTAAERVHVISIQIDFPCLVSSSPSHSSISGCHIEYTFPSDNLSTNEGDLKTYEDILMDDMARKPVDRSRYQLWWDGDCAVLNTRQSHRLSLDDNIFINESSIILLKQFLVGDFPSESIQFDIQVAFDSHYPRLGAIETADYHTGESIVTGTAELDLKSMYDLMRLSGINRSYLLPIQWSISDHQAMVYGDDILQYIDKYLPISISHRIEPRRVQMAFASHPNPDTKMEDELINRDSPISFHESLVDPMDDSILSSEDHDMMSKDQQEIEPLNPQPMINDSSMAADDEGISLEICLEEIANLCVDDMDSNDENYLLFATFEEGKTNRSTDAIESMKSMIGISKPRQLSSFLHHPQSRKRFIVWDDVIRLKLQSISPMKSSAATRSEGMKLSDDSEASLKHVLRENSLIVTLYCRHIWKYSQGKDMTDMNASDNSPSESNDITLKMSDMRIGKAVVDLTTLALGMPYLQGWYHVFNDIQDPCGQIKLRIDILQRNLSNAREDYSIDSLRENVEDGSMSSLALDPRRLYDLRDAVESVDDNEESQSHKEDKHIFNLIPITTDDLDTNNDNDDDDSIQRLKDVILSLDGTNERLLQLHRDNVSISSDSIDKEEYSHSHSLSSDSRNQSSNISFPLIDEDSDPLFRSHDESKSSIELLHPQSVAEEESLPIEDRLMDSQASILMDSHHSIHSSASSSPIEVNRANISDNHEDSHDSDLLDGVVYDSIPTHEYVFDTSNSRNSGQDSSISDRIGDEIDRIESLAGRGSPDDSDNGTPDIIEASGNSLQSRSLERSTSSSELPSESTYSIGDIGISSQDLMEANSIEQNDPLQAFGGDDTKNYSDLMDSDESKLSSSDIGREIDEMDGISHDDSESPSQVGNIYESSLPHDHSKNEAISPDSDAIKIVDSYRSTPQSTQNTLEYDSFASEDLSSSVEEYLTIFDKELWDASSSTLLDDSKARNYSVISTQRALNDPDSDQESNESDYSDDFEVLDVSDDKDIKDEEIIDEKAMNLSDNSHMRHYDQSGHDNDDVDLIPHANQTLPPSDEISKREELHETVKDDTTALSPARISPITSKIRQLVEEAVTIRIREISNPMTKEDGQLLSKDMPDQPVSRDKDRLESRLHPESSRSHTVNYPSHISEDSSLDMDESKDRIWPSGIPRGIYDDSGSIAMASTGPLTSQTGQSIKQSDSAAVISNQINNQMQKLRQEALSRMQGRPSVNISKNVARLSDKTISKDLVALSRNQKSFLDDETYRISQIMLGKLKSDPKR